MKPQKSNSKKRAFGPWLMRKDDLMAARQHIGRNMAFWSEPIPELIGLQVGKHDTVVGIAWREG